MKLPSLLVILSIVALACSRHCTQPRQRQEWRTLNDGQKRAYLDAVVCLQSLKSNGYYDGAKSRFDDFQVTHQALTDEIHHVGQFLAWHRYFLNIWEDTLRSECGWHGSLPYWNWSIDIDAGKFDQSPIFDPHTGFGGNGADEAYPTAGFFNNLTSLPGWELSAQTGGGCVTDGPFANYTLNIGPGTLKRKHCLTRAFNPSTFGGITGQNVKDTLAQYPFETFRIKLEGFPHIAGFETHTGGHLGVGGEMGNVYSSPGDALFYAHHAMLDSIWAKWQSVNSTDRMYQISGPSSVNVNASQVTLDFVLPMTGLGDNVPVRNVMDIKGGFLCYTYV
ncbi:hypothetical protein D9758_016621 [Tetrapyrgos nigripes]|uniref:Tyrosinase copper-binding domain-containing protein n=1 Tax=Tetrapyrgos nigripes TaxID=182062 RepID=A0A8H5C9M2_9AGAR|nr:hypothetical protein D9758_016621 [Tetrapyrgos nigripes]